MALEAADGDETRSPGYMSLLILRPRPQAYPHWRHGMAVWCLSVVKAQPHRANGRCWCHLPGITGAPRRARTPRSMAQPGQHSREGCWKRRAASAEGTPPAQAARAALGHSRSAPGEAPPAAWRSRPEGPATGCDCSAQAARDTAAEARPLAAGPSKGTAHAARPSSVHPMRCGVSNTSAASVPLCHSKAAHAICQR